MTFLSTKIFHLQSPDSTNAKEGNNKMTSYKLWPRKLSNTHSGSAPSLVSDLAPDRGENPANFWNKTSNGQDDLNKTR